MRHTATIVELFNLERDIDPSRVPSTIDPSPRLQFVTQAEAFNDEASACERDKGTVRNASPDDEAGRAADNLWKLSSRRGAGGARHVQTPWPRKRTAQEIARLGLLQSARGYWDPGEW